MNAAVWALEADAGLPGVARVSCGASSSAGQLLRGLHEVVDRQGAVTQTVGVTLTIDAGALGTPARNAAVTVSTGPLAGAYRFAQVLDGESDGLTETWLLAKAGAP